MSQLITDQYRAEQVALHAKGNYGKASLQYGETVAGLLRSTAAHSLLDYGCGSMRNLLKALALPPGVVYEGYDPAVPEYAAPPVPADLVCCIDVLEHIEPVLLQNVLGHLAELCDPYGFFTVHTGPAQKVLSDGRNAHLTQEGPDWWLPRVKPHFDVLALNSIPSGFALVVRSLKSDARLPLPAPLVLPAVAAPRQSPTTTSRTSADIAESAGRGLQLALKYKGERIVFHAADELELERIKSALKDQIETMRWLEALPKGATLLDVGVGTGVHPIIAAVLRRVTVFAIDADAQSVASVNTNAAANNVASRVVASVQVLGSPSVDLPSATHVATIDQLVASKTILAPDCMKISVPSRSLEILRGAESTLRSPKLSQLLVEFDSAPEEHEAAVKWLSTLGFKADPPASGTTMSSTDTESGAGAVIFRRGADEQGAKPWHRKFAITTGTTARGRAVLRHALARVAATELIEDPFPYAVIDGILPDDYYAEALAHFPSPESLRPIGESGRVSSDAYRERHVVLFTDDDFSRMSLAQQRFWREFADWMYSDVFLNAFIMKFHAALEPRLANILGESESLRARGDALLVNDQTNYAIGPHTDAPHRLVTFLFYLPRDTSMRELGTSIYRPKDPDFVCWGGPHHSFDKFDFVRTVEYLPNRLLAFPKTERSFHGVGQILREDVNRPLLINNIRLLNSVTH